MTVSRSFASMLSSAILAATSSASNVAASSPVDAVNGDDRLLQPAESVRESVVPGASGTSISRRMRSSCST